MNNPVALEKLNAAHLQLKALADARPGKQVLLDCPLLVACGEQMEKIDFFVDVRGSKNIAVPFFVETPLSEEGINRARGYDWIIAGSTWNAQVLEGHGLKNVSVVLQGIDPAIFHPGPRGSAGNEFRVYSGGKLEFRKGQDLVIAAMRKFQQRHADAVLVGAWHNFWPRTMRGIEAAGHVRGTPAARSDGTIDFAAWARHNGISRFIESPPLTNYEMAGPMRDADAALFPNRCEPGTNLVAMECMACGIPTILSANTGHLDLIGEERCYALHQQSPIASAGMARWGESSVDEMLEVLERVYVDRAEARRRGSAGAQWMKELSWENQIQLLLEQVAMQR
jgi:glycosyltransferase involved in cell wall biosynthesis